MGLSRFLVRVAANRPHVLLIEVPGGTRVRLVMERELRQRGWVAATSPPDTDVLVIIGPLGPRLQPHVDRVWQQIPSPPVYLHLIESDLESNTVAAALDGSLAISSLSQVGRRLTAVTPTHDRSAEAHRRDGVRVLDRLEAFLCPAEPAGSVGSNP